MATIVRAAPCARAARAIEEPIKAHADQRQAVEDGSALIALPTNSASAATTRRLASSLPTVMRSAFGSL